MNGNSYELVDDAYGKLEIYKGEIVEGRIEGNIPKYIYNKEKKEFLSVTSIERLFINETNLVYAPEIPDSVTDMNETFLGCTSLIQAPEIPDSVTNIKGTFYGCTSLTKAPEIPSSVTDMSFTFSRCSSLTGNLIINAINVGNVNIFLDNAATNEGCHLVLSGSCPKLQEIYEEVKDNPNITLAQ